MWQCVGAGEELSAAIDEGHIRDTDESKVDLCLRSVSVLHNALLRVVPAASCCQSLASEVGLIQLCPARLLSTLHAVVVSVGLLL